MKKRFESNGDTIRNMSNEELAKQILHEGSEAMKQFEISQSDEDEDI